MIRQWQRLIVLVALALFAAGVARADVVVGSKIDTEGTLRQTTPRLQERIEPGPHTPPRAPRRRRAVDDRGGQIEISSKKDGSAHSSFNKALIV